ncbi:MAG: hypothetical protein AAFY56_20215, partial [Pseudomonadota bacterium]
RSNRDRQVYFGGQGWMAAKTKDFAGMRTGEDLDGPMIVESPFTSVVIEPGARCYRSRCGSLVIDPKGAA